MTPTTTTQREEIDPQTARQWTEAGQAVLVDVREPDEHAAERIEGATLNPLSRFDPGQVPEGSKVILHCHSGRRSLEARARLTQMGRAEVYSMAGGIQGWRKAGLPTRVNPRAPTISIMRQVQMTAGSIVFIGTVLGLISPWFLIIPAFVGAGLVFAGLSGTCGMALMLARMPWNRALRTEASTCAP
jgi:rhodanese-related sulfurtransferase